MSLAPDLEFAVPNKDLRFRVTGFTQSEEVFLDQGRQSLADLERGLRVVDRTLADFTRVLDFGCGCGRVTRHLAQTVRANPGLELHGCDIDGEAVAWVRENLTFGTFIHNDGMPPLSYPDGYFDLVVNHSVFTHLPEDYQDAWLSELRRVVRPGGTLLLTVAGLFAFEGLVASYVKWPADPSRIQRVYREEGILYVTDDSWVDSTFPDFYHTTFHNPHYVLDHWGKLFTIEAFLPRGALGFQDLVVLRRPF
jgi:SAM-dependent methyltransferase